MLALIRPMATNVGLMTTKRAFTASAIQSKISDAKIKKLHAAGLTIPPSAPAGGYALFSKEFWSEHANEYRKADGKADIEATSTAAGEQWKSMSDSQKSGYVQQAESLRATYLSEVEKFGSALKPGELQKIEKVLGHKISLPGGRKEFLKERKLSTGKANGYMLFVQDQMASGKIVQDRSIPVRQGIADVGRACGEAWRGLSDSEKKVWNDKAKAASA